jgi:hypothetical protein
MTSIFPDSAAGGLIVREADGTPVEQPNVENFEVNEQFSSNCDILALPEDCNARFTPAQANAIVSELLNLFIAMSPTREWGCNELDNLASAFEDFVAQLAGGGEGGLTCSVQTGIAAESGNAYLMYCDGATLKKWSIHDEGGLAEFVLEQICSAEEATINNTDYILFCRNGILQRSQAMLLNLFTGEWLQARGYTTNNMVRKGDKLYAPNAIIPTGTAFTIGTSGQTWYEVSPTTFPSFDPDIAYSKDTIIYRSGKFYAANEDIAAGTPFNVGTSGPTWREVNFNEGFILDFDPAKSYRKFQVVISSGLIYRAKSDFGPGQLVPERWELVGGGRSKYRGEWFESSAYEEDDIVLREDILYRANGPIAANTEFEEGTGNDTWTEISRSSIAFSMERAYFKDDFVSFQGKLYIANDDIPAGWQIPTNIIGTTGRTWRDYTGDLATASHTIINDQNNAVNYPTNGVAVKPTVAYPSEPALWRTANGQDVFDSDVWQLIGERNKFRGVWNIGDTYKAGDIVFKTGIADPYGTMFEANTNINKNTAFQIANSGTNTWKRLAIGGSGGGGVGYVNLKIYNPASAYQAGDFVLTRWGIYQANGAIGAGDPFKDDTTSSSFSPWNSGRPVQTITAQNLIMNLDHRNATLAFMASGAKRFILTSGQGQMRSGDTISGYSVNGQLTIEGASNITLRTPDSGALRNRDYASFLIKCLSVSGSAAEYLLAGDLVTIP